MFRPMVYEAAIGASEVEWAGRTYAEINEVAERDGSVLVVPMGSLEQHGRHMPVMTDVYLATAVGTAAAEAVASEVPVMVTPPMWVGYSPYHLYWGGTLTGEFLHLLQGLQDVAFSGIDAGFDAVFFVNGHGGNDPLKSVAVQTVAAAAESPVEVLGVTYYYLAEPIIHDLRDSEMGGMSHAGEFETSLMMYLRPELVHEAEMEVNVRGERKGGYDHAFQDFFEDEGGAGRGNPLAVSASEGTKARTSGVTGDPTVATAAKGEIIFEFVRDELADLLRDVHANNR